MVKAKGKGKVAATPRVEIDLAEAVDLAIDCLKRGLETKSFLKLLQSRIGPELVSFDKNERLCALLYHAVQADDKHLVRMRLELGKDANQIYQLQGSQFMVNLMYLAHKLPGWSSAEKVRITTGPLTTTAESVTITEDFMENDVWHVPMVHSAAAAASWISVKLLVDAGADVNSRIPETGQTPTHLLGLALCSFAFIRKCRRAFPEVQHDVEKNNVQVLREISYSAKSLEILSGLVRKTAITLSNLGADICALDSKGRCPITSAIAVGQLHFAAVLIEEFSMEHRQKMGYRLTAYLKEAVEYEGRKGQDCKDDRGMERLVTALVERMQRPFTLSGVNQLSQQQAEDSAHVWRHIWESICGEGRYKHIILVLLRAIQTQACMIAMWLGAAVDSIQEVEELQAKISGQPRQPLIHFIIAQDCSVLLQGMESLANRLDFYARDEHGLLPLYIACKENKVAALSFYCSRLSKVRTIEKLLEQLHQRDLIHGITPLGYSVAWGYFEETKILLKACQRVGVNINLLLNRVVNQSLHHLPVFSAVVHGHPKVLRLLLGAGLDLARGPCIEHLEVSSGRYVKDATALTESLTLLMCAASLGNSEMVKMLLKAGAPAGEFPPGNKKFFNAVTMVLDHPDMDEQLRGDSPAGTSPRANTDPPADHTDSRHIAGPSVGDCLASTSQVEGAAAGSDKIPPDREESKRPVQENTRKSQVQVAVDCVAASSVAGKDAESGSSLAGTSSVGEATMKCPESASEQQPTSPVAARPCFGSDAKQGQDSFTAAQALSNAQDAVPTATAAASSNSAAYDHLGESLPTEQAYRRECNGHGSEQPSTILEADGPLNDFESEGPASQMSWLGPWLYDDAGPRFRCLLHLLRYCASLTADQMDKVVKILDACAGDYKEGDALAKLMQKRIKPCTNCCTYGRWKHCACRQAFFCTVECQYEHWPAHKQACKLARGLSKPPQQESGDLQLSHPQA